MDRKDRWSQLSMKQKADLIKLYTESGITDVVEIRRNYNSFDDGGSVNDTQYYDDTYIEPARVKAFKNQKEYNRYLGNKGARAVRRGTNKVAGNVAKALRYAPVVGDVMDGIEAYQDARSGNFKKAGVLAGLTLLPNAVEKPVRAVGKGLKNLRLYNRYVKDTKRFNEPMMYAFNGIKENYDVLKSNFPEMNIAEDVLRSMDTSVSTKFKLFEALRNRKGGYYSNNEGIWLNAFSPTRLKQAWKSPKKSIKALKGIAAHEGTHSALDNFNIPLSVRDRDYHKVIPGSVIDRKTSHLYNKSVRKASAWQNLPEEFIAEMNKVRYTLGEKPGSSINSWNIDHSNRGENYLSRIFNFEPGEAGELVDIYEGLGFANGGPINTDYSIHNNLTDRDLWFDTSSGKVRYDRAFRNYRKDYDSFFESLKGTEHNDVYERYKNLEDPIDMQEFVAGANDYGLFSKFKKYQKSQALNSAGFNERERSFQKFRNRDHSVIPSDFNIEHYGNSIISRGNDVVNYINELYNTSRGKRQLRRADRYAVRNGADHTYMGFHKINSINYNPSYASKSDFTPANGIMNIGVNKDNMYDFDSAIAHELGHTRRLYNTASPYGKSGSQYYNFDYSNIRNRHKRWLTPTTDVNEHDSELSEAYSDLMELRYNLYNNEIVDGTARRYRNRDIRDFLNTEDGKSDRYLKQHTNINKVRKALNKVYPDGGYLDRFEELEPAVVTDKEALTPLQESLRNYFNNKMWDSLLQDKLDRKLKKRNKGSLAGSLVPMIVTSRILDGRETEQTLSGKPVGEGLDTYNHPKYNHDEEAYIYSYLIGKGVPHTQASAIMGNLAVESMLDPHISQIGGGGGYGLIQATDKARKKSFMNYNGQPYEFGSKLDPETQRQLDYIIDKGLNTYTTGEWRRTKNIKGARQARKAFLSARDIETASNIFTDSYLRPGKPHRKRRLSMSNFFDRKYKNPYEVKFMYE